MSAHARSAEEVLADLDVTLEHGLPAAEARARSQRHGGNRIRRLRAPSAWRVLLDQFASLVVLLLLAAALVSAVLGQTVEAVAIAAALVVNAAIGFVTEYRATRSMASLRRLSRPTARVRRDGATEEVPTAALVPGDIVLLEEGEVVPADLRLISCENLECNEAALTGESMPVDKSPDPVEEETELADRRNMAYMGTAVSRGAAEAAVVAIGMETELGHIASMVEEAGEDSTPLERRLERLARRLLWLVLVLGVALAVAGIAAGKAPKPMLETALILAIAAVPEGLPIVSTVALARGMWRMARRNAIVNRLASVETLGATSVILSDKTGTLTENSMSVSVLTSADGEVGVGSAGEEASAHFEPVDDAVDLDSQTFDRMVEAVALCNNAELDGEEDEPGRGDPTEIALLELARARGTSRSELLERWPEVREESFSPDTKMMATFHRGEDNGVRVAVKGAPEAVLGACTRAAHADGKTTEMDSGARDRWAHRNRALAQRGLRVLAVAEKQANTESEEPYQGLVLLGLVGLHDPPRQEVKPALEACRRAGIRVVLVSGDQPATARAVAAELGITRGDEAPSITGAGLDEALADGDAELFDFPVLARVTPEQKLVTVEAYQEEGAVVGMTGDGVNDAPALKKADIGIAMGRRGTQAAREASDIVLEDDAFETIVAAVEQGRVIFDNIRRFIIYLLSGNLGEILAVGAAALVSAPLPLLPLQILFINLLFDVFPALALGVGEGTAAVMKRQPRPAHEPVLTRSHWILVAVFGAVIAASALAVFAVALEVLGLPPSRAVAVSFVTFGFARLAHVFNMRDPNAAVLKNDVTGNRYVWLAVLGCGLLLGSVGHLPGLSTLLHVTPLGIVEWSLIAAGGFSSLLLGQLVLAVQARRRQETPPSRSLLPSGRS